MGFNPPRPDHSFLNGFATWVRGLIEDINTSDLGSANTSYTYIPWASIGSKFGMLQMEITATTVTLEATCDPGSVADGSATWDDETLALVGVTSLTVSGEIIIDTPLLASRLRLKRVTTNATNAFEARLVQSN